LKTKDIDAFLNAYNVFTQCALRFDGYAFIDHAHEQGLLPREIGFPELNARVIGKDSLHDDDSLNFASFFALQRSLWKWCGVQLPHDAPERKAFYQLFLHLKNCHPPNNFMRDDYLKEWGALPMQQIEAAVDYCLEQLGDS